MASPMAQRIVDTYLAATDDERIAGLNWYAGAWAWCQEQGDRYNCPALLVAGIVAATSANAYWSRNKTYTLRALDQLTSTGTYQGWQAKKVNSIWSTAHNAQDVASNLGQEKTLHFFWAIVSKGQTLLHVAVDRWQIRVATGNPAYTQIRDTGSTYPVFVEAHKEATTILVEEHGMAYLTPALVQAVTWVVVRGSAD